MNKNKSLIILIAAFVVFGVITFYAGTKVGSQGSAKNNFQRASLNNGFVSGQQKNMGNGVSGEIVSIGSDSMTVKTANGSSKIVFYSQTTKVSKSVDGAISDLATGNNVMITGTTNQDGSVTAKSIQLRTEIINQEGGAPKTNSPSLEAK